MDIPFVAISIVLLVCWIASLLLIAKSQRGWRDEKRYAALLNLLGLWIGVIGMNYISLSLSLMVHLFLAQNAYLLLRRSTSL